MWSESKHRKQEAFLGTAACVAVVVLSGYVVQSWAPVAILSFVFTLPLWVPRLVVALRFHAFERLNGHEGIQLPNEQFDAEATKFLYNHPNANIRSRQNGVGLSDFFWYLLAPAHEVHQEHVENSSPKYQLLANVTKSVVNRPQKELVALVLKHAQPLFESMSCGSWTVVNLRRWWMPVFIRAFYELTFDEECPLEAEKIIFDSADDLIRALKFCGVRNMATRAVLTDYLKHRLQKGAAARHFPAEGLTLDEKALFLQGVVFHTGTIQMAEGMAHLCLSIAQHKGNFDQRLVTNPRYLGYFLSESLRMFPLFGIAHRITSEAIAVPMKNGAEDKVIPKGAVLCFNYPALHREGFEDPGKFDPHRFVHVTEQNSHFMPFGAPNNRPCPGRSISWCWMKVLAKEMLQHVVFLSPVLHTRSMPTGGVCVVAKRSGADKNSLPTSVSIMQPAIMTGIWLYEQGSSVPRSVIQMVSGLYMLWHAQQLKLAKSWNERQDAQHKHKAAKA